MTAVSRLRFVDAGNGMPEQARGESITIAGAESELDDYWFVPTETSGKRANDRAIQCIVYSYAEVTRTLEGASR